jgi:hypothetical protein
MAKLLSVYALNRPVFCICHARLEGSIEGGFGESAGPIKPDLSLPNMLINNDMCNYISFRRWDFRKLHSHKPIRSLFAFGI